MILLQVLSAFTRLPKAVTICMFLQVCRTSTVGCHQGETLEIVLLVRTERMFVIKIMCPKCNVIGRLRSLSPTWVTREHVSNFFNRWPPPLTKQIIGWIDPSLALRAPGNISKSNHAAMIYPRCKQTSSHHLGQRMCAMHEVIRVITCGSHLVFARFKLLQVLFLNEHLFHRNELFA